jgi:ArsR family transcriptional regulator
MPPENPNIGNPKMDDPKMDNPNTDNPDTGNPNTGNPKKALFAQFAVVAQALAHANRLALLEFLCQGERNVDALAALTGMSVANTSQHLQRLQRAGLIAARRDGHAVRYSVADPAIVTLLGALRAVAENNIAEVGALVAKYFDAKDSLESVTQAELLRRSRQGLVTVLDVRPPEEFAAGHLPGAVNIPLQDLKHRLGELPETQEIVAYCRGPYCVLSLDAVETLRAGGYQARRMEDGLPEWKLAGYPVEV